MFFQLGLCCSNGVCDGAYSHARNDLCVVRACDSEEEGVEQQEEEQGQEEDEVILGYSSFCFTFEEKKEVVLVWIVVENVEIPLNVIRLGI